MVTSKKFPRKKSIVVEYEYHYGFLLLVIKILASDGSDVDVYCSDKFCAFFNKKTDGIHNVRLISEYSAAVGTYRAIADSKYANIFFHFSVQAHKYSTFVRLLKPKAKFNILYTPRLTNWHDQKLKFKPTKRNMIENYFNIFRYFIKKNYNFYIVHSDQMVNFIRNSSDRKVMSLPYTIRSEKKNQQQTFENNSKLKVTILGSIDKSRRDYLSIFNESVIKDLNLSNLEFELAGVPNGSNFLSDNTEDNYFKMLKIELSKISKSTGCKFITYNNRLDDDQYNSSICQADILLMPVNVQNYPLGSWSAGLAESIEEDKRVMFPQKYDVPADYTTDYLTYYDALDLMKKLNDIATDPSKCGLSDDEKIKRDSAYSLKKISKRFFNDLQS